MIYKIVQGNSFKLHILVRKLDFSTDFERLVDFDMSLATNIKVELCGSFCEPISVPYTITGISKNVLVCDIPGTLELGNYNVKVSWKYEGYSMNSVERNLLRIVEHNSQTKVPIGIVDAETSGLFNLRYYIVTENQSTCQFNVILNNLRFAYIIEEERKEFNLSQSHYDWHDSLRNGERLQVELIPLEGFNIGLVKVIMNGTDITADTYKDGTIIIPAVSGYVTIMANGDASASYYGATSAKNMSELEMSDLTKLQGDLIGKTLTVTTTEERPYIWFVSHVPVVFTQAGLEAAMNTQQIGDLYYYWSDELTPGDDNEYTIKLKE